MHSRLVLKDPKTQKNVNPQKIIETEKRYANITYLQYALSPEVSSSNGFLGNLQLCAMH